MKQLITSILCATTALLLSAQTPTVKINVGTKTTQKIHKEIYGQFAEHLGTCIYGGLWVGNHTSIPNTNGYRNDVLQALQDLKIPVLRWPGGCLPMNTTGWTASDRVINGPKCRITTGVEQ